MLMKRKTTVFLRFLDYNLRHKIVVKLNNSYIHCKNLSSNQLFICLFFKKRMPKTTNKMEYENHYPLSRW